MKLKSKIIPFILIMIYLPSLIYISGCSSGRDAGPSYPTGTSGTFTITLSVADHKGNATALDISWTLSSSSTSIYYYRIYYGTTSGLYTQSIQTTDTETQYTITGLTANRTYYIQVRALNEDQQEIYSSNEASGTPVTDSGI